MQCLGNTSRHVRGVRTSVNTLRFFHTRNIRKVITAHNEFSEDVIILLELITSLQFNIFRDTFMK